MRPATLIKTGLLLATGLAAVQLHATEAASPPARAPLAVPVAPVIPDVPVFRAATLQLADLPRPTGPVRRLFNGHDFAGLEPWLGYDDPALTYTFPQQAPLGSTGLGDVFKVVDVDGAPVILVTGRIWGALLTPDLGNVHLRLYYKWGAATLPGAVRNSGILYHSHGPLGGFMGTWMNSVEFDMMPPNTGMAVPVGDVVRYRTEIGEDGPGFYRYMPGGKSVTVGFPTWVHTMRDAERPSGEWNQLDLYLAGDRSVHVVNGVPVLALSELALVGKDGVSHPLTHGRIQLQSEGWEIYLRDITVEPIEKVPRVVAAP